MSYSLLDYLSMIGDPVRTGAYSRALRKVVTPDSVVLDLGAGFGFFAVLAARLGARRAYAVEMNDVIGLGPALARANGVADRVTFFHGDSRSVVLPERANVLVEDVRGMMPLHVERIALLRDARARLLTDDATYVARRDRLWASPARHPAFVLRALETVGPDVHGVDLRGLRSFVVDGSRRGKSAPEDLLLPGASLGALELATVSEPHFEGTACWTPDQEITADGFVVWFDSELAGGEYFSAQPGPRQSAHGSLYLPLREPVTVRPAEELAFRFCGVQAAGDYAWTWECHVTGADGCESLRSPRQSTLSSLAFTPKATSAMSELHRPTLGPEGERVRAAIPRFQGEQTSREIAAELAGSSSLGFGDGDDALQWLQRTIIWLEEGRAYQL